MKKYLEVEYYDHPLTDGEVLKVKEGTFVVAPKKVQDYCFEPFMYLKVADRLVSTGLNGKSTLRPLFTKEEILGIEEQQDEDIENKKGYISERAMIEMIKIIKDK